jgi:YD repeat-containing protein
VIRFWIKPATEGQAITGVSVADVALTSDDLIATIHGWSLVETQRDLAPTSTSFTISAPNMTCSTFVDDLVVHPPVGASAAIVYDDEYRPTASFSSDHFPNRVAYDATGKAAITHMHRATGLVASVASAGYLPRTARPSQGSGAYTTGLMHPVTMKSARDMLRNDLDAMQIDVPDLLRGVDTAPQGVGASGNVLDLNLTPESMVVQPGVGAPVVVPILQPAAKDTTKGSPK